MYSERNGCFACICDENFDNTTIAMNPSCQKIKCNIEIHYADRIMAGCIPIYYGKANCCPIGWRCREYTQYIADGFIQNKNKNIYLRSFAAERKDEIILTNQAPSNDTNMTCTFGSLVLNVGDKIRSEKYCVDCSCKIPPMMHCVQIGHC